MICPLAPHLSLPALVLDCLAPAPLRYPLCQAGRPRALSVIGKPHMGPILPGCRREYRTTSGAFKWIVLITILGAIAVTALSASFIGKLVGTLAIIAAAINVVAGFGVTDRMLRMFNTAGEKGESK